MSKVSTEKRKIWQGHIENAKEFPGGVAGYCRAHGLPTSGFYTWRRTLAKASPSAGSPFLPIVIQKNSTDNKLGPSPSLPDARWVAEMMVYLMRGLS